MTSNVAWLLVPDGFDWVFQKLRSPGIFTHKKNPARGKFYGQERHADGKKVNGEFTDLFKLSGGCMVTQIPSLYNSGERNSILKHIMSNLEADQQASLDFTDWDLGKLGHQHVHAVIQSRELIYVHESATHPISFI